MCSAASPRAIHLLTPDRVTPIPLTPDNLIIIAFPVAQKTLFETDVETT